MAEIYKARYEPVSGVSKNVVIKKILPHYAENKTFLAMFTNEARIVMDLSHGNIAQVFDFGTIDGDAFIAMELVDGEALSKLIRRARTLGVSRLPTEFAVFIVSEILKGLHYAHTRLDKDGGPLKIVHRDVSPQNVLLSHEGQVKLVDFGIAKAKDDGLKEDPNAVKGKYAYFSPEQSKGLAVDARTDVFSAGIVLYELLVGELPFQGNYITATISLGRGEFKKPREVNRNIPVEVEKAILKAMASDQDERFQSAAEFHEALSRYLSLKHPGFTEHQLGLFSQWVFETELVAQGRPVKLPASFLDQLSQWRSPMPIATPQADEPTTDVAMAVNAPIPKFLPAPLFQQRKSGNNLARIAVVAALFGAVAVTGTAVFQKFSSGTLEITSAPGGAHIRVDGKALSAVTPIILESIEPAEHEIELTLEGFVAWKNKVPLSGGQHLEVNATFEKPPQLVPEIEAKAPVPEAPVAPVEIAPAVPLPPVPEPEALDAGAPKPEAQPTTSVPNTVNFPFEKIRLETSRHRLQLTRSNAAFLALESTKTYQIELSEHEFRRWGYSVKNNSGSSFGEFTAQPLQIAGASELVAFYVPGSALEFVEKSKPQSLLVKGPHLKKSLEIPLALSVPNDARVNVRGLDRKQKWTFSLDKNDTHVVLLAQKSGLYFLSRENPVTMAGAELIWLSLLEGEAMGEIEVGVSKASP
jgi:serine/threonine protein kinase